MFAYYIKETEKYKKMYHIQRQIGHYYLADYLKLDKETKEIYFVQSIMLNEIFYSQLKAKYQRTGSTPWSTFRKKYNDSKKKKEVL